MASLHKRKRTNNMSVRFGLTATDQCVSSLSNFVVGVAVARVVGVSGFGAYALVYSVWLVVAALHRSLITDPMSIENDVQKDDADFHVRVGLAAEMWLGLASAVVFALVGVVLLVLGQTQFGVCFLGLAPWLPCLLAQDYWRWISFMRRQPEKALANDIVFGVVQLVVFVALVLVGFHSTLVAIGAWGVGALAGALYGLRQFSARVTMRGGLERIRSRWGLSKWLAGVNVMASASQQSTPVITSIYLGPTGIGGLKAAASLVSGPSLVLIQAGGSIGLPEAAKGLKDRGWPGLRRVARYITGAGMASVGLIAVIIFCFGRILLDKIYGPSFGQFSDIADILAVSVFFSSTALGAILCLKSTRQTHRLFYVSAISFAVSIVAVVILAPLFGIVGAAFATMIGSGASTIGLLYSHWTTSKKTAIAMHAAGEDQLSEQEADEVLLPGFLRADADVIIDANNVHANTAVTDVVALPSEHRHRLRSTYDPRPYEVAEQEVSIE